jgi:hypothetical protein
VLSPRVVVCRAKTQEDAIKMAQDLLQKGVEAAKNVDVNQVCCPNTPSLLPLKSGRRRFCRSIENLSCSLSALVLFVEESRTGTPLCVI